MKIYYNLLVTWPAVGLQLLRCRTCVPLLKFRMSHCANARVVLYMIQVYFLSDYGLDDRWSRFNPQQRWKIYPLAFVSRLAMGPTQPPNQCVSGVLSHGVKCSQGLTLTTYPHLVARSWWAGAIPPLPSAPLWCVVGLLYFSLLTFMFFFPLSFLILIYICSTLLPSVNIFWAWLEPSVRLCSGGWFC
jgi:hypothetical protein